MMSCPLCQTSVSAPFFGKYFYHCETCDLMFKDKSAFLPADEEKSRYQTHNNDLNDPRYRSYLENSLSFLELKPGMKVLDFGSGPTEALSLLLKEKGVEAKSYDPHFFPLDWEKEARFDGIIMSESIEHFYTPLKELELALNHLKKDGFLFIKTERHKGEEHFSHWYYHRDPTHVIFFSEKSFQFLAQKYSLETNFVSSNMVMLRRNHG